MKKLLIFIASFYFSSISAQSLKLNTDSVKLNQQIELYSEFEKWCCKHRTFKEYEYIKNSYFWEKLNIEIIPHYENDCRGYNFKLKSKIPITIDLIKEILNLFKDD